MNTETLRKLHHKEVEILKQLIEICEKLNIQYFAAYGTAIGAMRHQGFIPWDDDIDVGMLRADFERFIEKAPSLLPKHMFLQYRHSDPNYNILHAKLRDNNTTFLEPDWEKRKGSQGIFIDIFPFDYIPENLIKLAIVKFRKKYYQCIISTDSCINYWKLPGFKNKIRALVSPLINLLYPNRQKAAIKLDSLLKKITYSDKICDYEVGRSFQTKWFTKTQKVPFEEIEISVPIECHDYLTANYGDYMTPPPIEQQAPRHFGGVIDTERPYTYYTEKPLN